MTASRRAIAELDRRVERLEWESRHRRPCHCGHDSRDHWGLSLRDDFGTSCMRCRCDAYSPPTEEASA